MGGPDSSLFLDWAVFGLYFVALIGIGLLVGRRRSKSRDYFLAGRTLPWYVIGCSMIAANISGEQLVGMVGASYVHGLVVANWCWLGVFGYSLLIFVFLPYYLKHGFFTMPEFLELRYGPAARGIFAAVTVIIDVIAYLGPTLYIGGIVLNNFLGVDARWTIIGLTLIAGSYSIFGGLLSVAWTDVLQCIVIYGGGLLLGIKSVIAAGGIGAMMSANPEHFHVIRPPTDPLPFLGMLLLLPSVSLWYICTNQFYIQRCLAARTEWDSRMGVVFAGYLQVIMPIFVVLPGLAAAKLLTPAQLPNPDDAYVTMVRLLIPQGLRGVIIAALVAAVVSTVSSLVNSTGTIATLDIYKRFMCKDRQPSDRDLVWVGRVTGGIVLFLGCAMGLLLVGHRGLIFAFIQDMAAHVAPPFATLFLLGILWRGPGLKPAILTIVVGLSTSIVLQYILIPNWIFAGRDVPPFVFLYRLGVVWGICVATLVVSSFLWPVPKTSASLPVEIWTPEYLRLPRHELAAHSGWKDFRIWWFIFAAAVVALMIYFR